MIDKATMSPMPSRAPVVRPAARAVASPPAPRRRWIMWGGLALVAVAVIGAIASRMLPASVTATTVARRDVARTLVLTGRVRPPSRSRLGSTLSGTVLQVSAREGDHVSRGQLLLRLDDGQAQAGVAQATAALAQAEAQGRSGVVQAEGAAAQANRDLSRARALFAAGAISARELEVAERAAADARAQLDAARARVDGVNAALTEVARARGVLATANAQLALTRVRSPAGATVLERHVEPGDAVTPGQVLLELALDGPTELVAFAREETLGELVPAMPATASADAFPARTFAAHIASLAPVVDPAQGTVEVRFAIPDPPPYLRADMTVSLNVEVARRSRALVVPRDLVHDLASTTPWVTVARDGRAVRRDIRIGVVGENDIEVLAGLADGDQVLPVGIAPGARVRVSR